MATQSEIRRDITNTRSHISYIVDEITDNIQHRFDIEQKIRENPTTAVVAALAAGFLVASLSSSVSRSLLKFGMRTAFAAASAYASKRAMSYIMGKRTY
ncbi:MAG: hypothetical protein A2287_05890 [Candidatus Melainabacteria bacterium RIFOXYA12_FULL_32_12]|nr:MAG: hypothetical protein A2104_04435 [Candidatus Melainabacteria bacterium GWF2_32_7]OGI30880.1 MAG: hypothetical protein A2287_05890 [Candidatus Melainabacteria bacterium RIFOXYA12_FULL_32_12]